MKTIKHFTLIVALFSIVTTGCKTLNRSQKGAAVGAAGGGVIGAVVGKALGNTAMGAIIGAAVGGASGAVIGKKMDKQAEEIKKVLGDAAVRRVGEGIVVEFKEKVLFAFDRSNINASAKRNLNRLSDVLKKYPDTNIEIIGHTDDKGTDEYNLNLSQKRAASVSSYLKKTGIGNSRLIIKGMGESDPKIANDSDISRAENRRVEFAITANQKMVEEAKREAGQ
jgi:outer membrane protein OmpA-like peptidoglycan-associated protein